MGTHANVSYMEKCYGVGMDGGPECVIEVLQEAVGEAKDSNGKDYFVIRSVLTDWAGSEENGAWWSPDEEWAYELYSNNGVYCVKIFNYGKLKYDGPLSCVPPITRDEEE